MSRDYKIGDLVIYTNKIESATWEKYHCGISLYGKVAKIIYIENYIETYKNKTFENDYLLEFKKYIGGGSSYGKGKNGYCMWSPKKQFKSIDHLKFKKWINVKKV